jgi:hypothetical protein
MTAETKTSVLPTIYAVHIRSNWAGDGPVNRIVAVALSHAEAEQLEAAGEWNLDGQYGNLFTRVEEHTPSRAMQTLAAKGAVIDHMPERIWIAKSCMACSDSECREYKSMGHNPRPLTSQEYAYIAAHGALTDGLDN